MDRSALVRAAADRFAAGDDEGFVASFDPAVRIYSEPELSGTPIISSRAELAVWVERSRRSLDGASATLCNIEEHADGVVADAIVVVDGDGSEFGWRVALAIRFAGELIGEVRPFWQRDAALGSLVNLV
jgi:ketosteroid isomerase-like protein